MEDQDLTFSNLIWNFSKGFDSINFVNRWDMRYEIWFLKPSFLTKFAKKQNNQFFVYLNLRVIKQSNEVKNTKKQNVNAEVLKWAMSETFIVKINVHTSHL